MTPSSMWHSVWHSSIKNRLTFLFFCITAGAKHMTSRGGAAVQALR